MATLTELRSGIATNISNNITIVDVFAYVPDRAEPPLAVVGVLDTLEYDTTMARGSDKYLIPVRLFVANVDGQDSQETLDQFIKTSGSNSMKSAIESDLTLGGVASSVRVTEVRDYGAFELNNTNLLGVEFVVEVIG
tara:strand:- start:254 stop:664 length:411 start_codon:yes stop_codon:yes gene_type:complete